MFEYKECVGSSMIPRSLTLGPDYSFASCEICHKEVPCILKSEENTYILVRHGIYIEPPEQTQISGINRDEIWRAGWVACALDSEYYLNKYPDLPKPKSPDRTTVDSLSSEAIQAIIKDDTQVCEKNHTFSRDETDTHLLYCDGVLVNSTKFDYFLTAEEYMNWTDEAMKEHNESIHSS